MTGARRKSWDLERERKVEIEREKAFNLSCPEPLKTHSRSSEAIDGSSAAPAPAAAAPPSVLNEAVLWLFPYVDSTFNPKREQQEPYHRLLSHGKNMRNRSSI